MKYKCAQWSPLRGNSMTLENLGHDGTTSFGLSAQSSERAPYFIVNKNCIFSSEDYQKQKK